MIVKKVVLLTSKKKKGMGKINIWEHYLPIQN
jgi:hypothetical protein